MLGDNLDVKVVKYGVACILSVLALIIIMFVKFITGSYLMGIIVFIVLVWLLIFKIGITIMYPGSSNYYTSDIQIRVGNEFAKTVHHLGHCFQFVASCIVQKKVQFTASQWSLRQKVLGNIHTTIQMLSMFQNNLSQRKAKILQIFRHLLQQIQSRHSQSSVPLSQTSVQPLKSIGQFLEHPKKIKDIQSDEHKYLCQRIKSIINLNNQLQQIISTYKQPQRPLDFIKYKFFQQKLYQVRFGYQRWNHIFQYEVHLISNHGYVLECAIIKRNKSNHQNEQPQLNGKYVLFCNPNGVYIQFFAMQNTYIREYLKQGYQVILWNYRGYGQSTGSPSITKSQTDATKVYNYFSAKGLKIEVVHGYSIGGCAAIGLVSKLQKKQKQDARPSRKQNILRSQRIPNNVKILIVDRSFSSIGDMAIEFGQTLHKLAKIVFTFQNTNLSKQFTQLKTSKLILWDKNDQVIPDTASVKGGIISGIIGVQQQSSCKSCSNCMRQQQQNSLNQEVSVLINQKDDTQYTEINRKFMQRFSNAIKILLRQSCGIDKTNDLDLNTNHQYDPNEVIMQENQVNTSVQNNQGMNMTEKTVSQIFNALQQIDGGGLFLPSPISQFRKIMQSNPISFQYKCNSFIVGLAHYGSIAQLQIAFSSRTQIQAHTIKKIQQILRNFTTIFQSRQQTNKIMQPQIINTLQNLKRIFIEVKNIIQIKFLLQENDKYGKVISLNSGHNGSLSSEQLRYLMKYIRQISQHNQDQLSRGDNNVSQLNHLQQRNRMQRESNSNTNLNTYNNSNIQNTSNSGQFGFNQ